MKKLFVLIVVMLILGTLPTVWAQEPLPLNQTYVSDDGELMFNYPMGWIVQEDENVIMVSNSEDAVAADEIGEGQIGLSIWKPSSVATFGADTPEDVLTVFADTVTSANNTAFIGLITETRVGDRRVARARFGDDSFKGTVLAFDLDDENTVLVLLFGLASDTAYEDFEPTLHHITESIVLTDSAQEVEPTDGGLDAKTPSDVTLTESFSGVGMTISYPAGWIGREGDIGMGMGIELATSEDTLGAMDDPDARGIGPGQAAMFITAPISPADVGGSAVSDMVLLYAQGMALESDEAQIGDLNEIEIGDHSAWLITFSEEASTREGAIVGLEPREGVYLIVMLVAHTGEFAESQQVMLDIIGSVVLDE